MNPGTEPPRPLLVCGDFDSRYCGVGGSEAALAHHIGDRPEHLDPLAPLRHVLKVLRRTRRSRQPVVIAFPTRSTVRSLRAHLVFALATVAGRRRGGVRWRLHEYQVFREVRWLLNVWFALGADRVIVSRRSEAEVLATQRPSWLLSRLDVVVRPPANATPAPADPVAPTIDADTVGMFGFFRPEDRNIDWMAKVLLSLPERFNRLQCVGEAWSEAAWPPDVTARYAVETTGSVPAEELTVHIARWGLAVASFADGAADHRMSLRTPLAYGVPTVVEVHRPDDLTMDVPHLVVVAPDGVVDPADIDRATALDRHSTAAAVAAFELRCRDRLAVVQYGSASDDETDR